MKKLAAFCVLAALAAALTGCSGKQAETETTMAAVETTAAPTTETTEPTTVPTEPASIPGDREWTPPML